MVWPLHLRNVHSRRILEGRSDMNGSSPEFLPAWLRAAVTKHFTGSKSFDFLVEYTVNRDFEGNFLGEKNTQLNSVVDPGDLGGRDGCGLALGSATPRIPTLDNSQDTGTRHKAHVKLNVGSSQRNFFLFW